MTIRNLKRKLEQKGRKLKMKANNNKILLMIHFPPIIIIIMMKIQIKEGKANSRSKVIMGL